MMFWFSYWAFILFHINNVDALYNNVDIHQYLMFWDSTRSKMSASIHTRVTLSNKFMTSHVMGGPIEQHLGVLWYCMEMFDNDVRHMRVNNGYCALVQCKIFIRATDLVLWARATHRNLPQSIQKYATHNSTHTNTRTSIRRLNWAHTTPPVE